MQKERYSSISSETVFKELFILQRENAEEELEFQRRRELIMEKTKPEVRPCQQGEKWSLSQVWRCLDTNIWNGSSHSVNLCVKIIVYLSPLFWWWCFGVFLP